jgi:phage recombination protein Bet
MGNDNNNPDLVGNSNICNLIHFRSTKNHRSNLTMSASQQLATTPARNTEISIDEKTFLVLKNNLYKEATSDDSIKMVINYCVGRNIDPLLKAVHIVPMWNKNTNKSEDTVMPGIGLYRIIAARSGQYAGMSEPIYGPMVTEKLGTMTVTFPEWCMIIVKKFIQGHIVEYPAKEYWIENYASKGKDPTPNAMWLKRKFGQIAKCAEAQALRKAFPEVGHDYTYEELQGKTFDHDDEPRKQFDVIKSIEVKQISTNVVPVEYDHDEFMAAVEEINSCKNETELKTVFTAAYKNQKIICNAQAKNNLVKVKDEKKLKLGREEFLDEYDSSTGEVSQATEESV